MKYFEAADMASRIGEAIGSAIAIGIICLLTYITLAAVLHF
jgi:Mn2+/Fe2+ NRAMP family transporter